MTRAGCGKRAGRGLERLAMYSSWYLPMKLLYDHYIGWGGRVSCFNQST